ncbi:hypothetical protein N7466_011683 [Penicillium verhagenii]|uniref:uncharacterized protein n=1 Tax=Penicillium verhagenii TaxID=1562060 RepID=UPI002545356B|nr:uncharacterized protein N7466_011683 [Penicillium verhagenii]KAJ5915750.1 hypothetical protein N7466_011683 [Penicillium verhagenii]
MAESTPIGVALIGGEPADARQRGIWAKEEHAHPPDPLAEGVSYSVDLYSEDLDEAFDELLQRPDHGAVIIALSIESQPRYIKAALLAGKHVLSEKPIAEISRMQSTLIKWYRTELRGHQPGPLRRTGGI